MGGGLRDDGTGGLTARIIGAAIEVHRALGPGLLEKPYEVCFAAELWHRGISAESQVPQPVVYRVAPVHVSQVLTHLRLADLRVGLLFNFNVTALAAGGFNRILLDR